MPRVYLRVPFEQKEQAKRLGARWDPRQKTWYVPDGINSSLLKEWLPLPERPNVRAPRWFLAMSTRTCWRCDASSRVYAIVLPPGYEALNVGDDPADDDYWERGANSTLLSYLVAVAVLVAAQLRRLAPRYRVDYSQTAHSFYWMNHCEHCEAKLGDFETMEESGTFYGPDHAFEVGGCRSIDLREIGEPFAGSCGSYTL
jgi:hypothetical protein